MKPTVYLDATIPSFYKHLANANKFDHIQVLNARRRLVSPALITPAQLLEMEP